MIPDTILKNCVGVKTKITRSSDDRYDIYTFFKVGDIKVPDNVLIEITGTATNGTIARVSDILIETYEEAYPESTHKNPTELLRYDTTFIYEVDGRTQKGRIKARHTRLLEGHHETKYVRDVNKHAKVELKNPVNKYKQEMQKGDWVIGVKKKGKTLGIGRITRWTNSNVWAVTGDDLKDKSKEFMFSSILETFTMPNDEHVQMLTMAVLKGWQGN